MTPVVETTNEDIPRDDLADFTTIIHHLIVVFNLGNADNKLFNIFWYPDDLDLMGFNRRRLIFLNLAHYARKRTSDFILTIESGDMYHP
jgi:hypothetical protein